MPGFEKNLQSLDPEHLEGCILSGRYKMLNRIGKGGTAVVYLAWDLSLEKEWAVKVLRADCGPEAAALFRKEAAWLKRLSHPFLPRIVEVIPFGHSEALVMDYLSGKTLEEIRIRNGRQGERSVRKWALWILDVLSYLHEAGIVFRDLKPANVILREEGGIWLLDFGIACELSRQPEVQPGMDEIWAPEMLSASASEEFFRQPETIHTQPGQSFQEMKSGVVTAGTPGYAPPEQLKGCVCDAGNDRYALGMLMYAMLSGREPEEKTRPGPILSKMKPAVSGEIIRIIETCTAKNPETRFASDEELKRALMKPEGFPETHHRVKNHRKAAFICSVLLSAACLSTGIFFRALSAFTTEQLYQKKIDLVLEQGSTAGAAGRKQCLEAISLIPERVEGYELLLDVCTSSGELTETDGEALDQAVSESGRELDLSEERVQELYLRIGIVYFCLNESGGEEKDQNAGLSYRKGILYAEKYFDELSNAETTRKDIREKAESFGRVCDFFRRYQIRMDPTDDADSEEYMKLLKSIRKSISCLAGSREIKGYAFLSATGEMTNLLNSQREWMLNLGIQKKEILKTLETIEDASRDVTPQNRKTADKKEKVLADCGYCRAALEAEDEKTG